MKIKFGAIVTDGRGKIGGHVASKNRAGAYLRTKVTPSNPNTVFQSQARAILATFSASWSQLTDDARLAWNNAVADWSGTDIFGDIKNPSGLNLYVKLNANLANAGLASVGLPPAKMETPPAFVTGATYDISSDNLTITLSDSTGDGVTSIIRATPALSAGVSFVKNAFRMIGVTTPAIGEAVLLTGYSDRFGTIEAGANVYATIQFVLPNGQKSVEQKVKVVVTA